MTCPKEVGPGSLFVYAQIRRDTFMLSRQEQTQLMREYNVLVINTVSMRKKGIGIGEGV